MNFSDEENWMGRLAELTALTRSSGKTLRIGECVVDCRTGLVRTSGHVRRLRRKELELLTYLHRCSAPVGRDQSLRDVWNCSKMVTRTVDQTVATLRQKLEDDSTEPKYLLTIYGVGYQLRKVSEP